MTEFLSFLFGVAAVLIFIFDAGYLLFSSERDGDYGFGVAVIGGICTIICLMLSGVK